jgi:hypothetical protein
VATEEEGRELALAIREGRLRLEDLDNELIDRAMAKMSSAVPASIRAEVRRDLERTIRTYPAWERLRQEVRRRLENERLSLDGLAPIPPNRPPDDEDG